MNAKQETFKYLDTLKNGIEIAGIVLASRLNIRTQGYHYPDTFLRYMREYRQKTGRRIVCINKRKSLYKIESALTF